MTSVDCPTDCLGESGLALTLSRLTGCLCQGFWAAIYPGDSQALTSAGNCTFHLTALFVHIIEGTDENRADLIEVATTDRAQFAHAAQRARDDRARAKVKADTEAELSAHGFTILDRDRGYYETDYIHIRELIASAKARTRAGRTAA